MRVSDIGKYIVICHKRDFDTIGAALGTTQASLWKNLALFPSETPRIGLKQGKLGTTNLEIQRYLDRFYLCLSDSDHYRRQMVSDFFELIADDYEKLIDRPRN